MASASGLRTWAGSPVSLCGGPGTLAQAPPSADEHVPRWTAPRPCPRKRLVTCLSPGRLPAGELTHVAASEDTPSPGRSSPPGSSGLSARPGRCHCRVTGSRAMLPPVPGCPGLSPKFRDPPSKHGPRRALISPREPFPEAGKGQIPKAGHCLSHCPRRLPGGLDRALENPSTWRPHAGDNALPGHLGAAPQEGGACGSAHPQMGPSSRRPPWGHTSVLPHTL